MSGREEEIVTLVTMCGEIVGRALYETDMTITLKSPLLFVPGGEDNAGGGFAPGISMTGAQGMHRGEFNKSCILTIIPAHDQVAEGWLKATSSIIIQGKLMENNKKPEMLLEIVGESNQGSTDVWKHNCRYNGILMVGKEEPCAWCGTYEDGTTDQYK